MYSWQVVHRTTTTQDGWTVQRQQVYPWSTASRVTVRNRISIDHKRGGYGDRYVMVKRSPHLPRFYEAFVNYGKDKISWIENLRYIGYKFGVVTQSFATDIPHPKYIVSTREEGIDQRGSMTGQRRWRMRVGPRSLQRRCMQYEIDTVFRGDCRFFTSNWDRILIALLSISAIRIISSLGVFVVDGRLPFVDCVLSFRCWL